jgi:hypothetical protein
MIDKFKELITKIIIKELLENYRICKTTSQTKQNYKNYASLEKILMKGDSEQLIINYENENYIFDVLDDSDTNVKIYVLQSKDSDSDCIMISINKISGIASINNLLSDGLICSEKIITNIGALLFELTIKLIKKYKDKFNIQKILLSDHSSLYCNQIRKIISLADLHTLKHGITFYGKFGFTPYDSDNSYNVDSNKKLNKKFNKNKEIIKNLKVKDSKLLYYLEKFQNKGKYDINKIINYVKDNQDELLSEVITVLSSKENFNMMCEVLNYIIPKLFNANRLTSFHNKSFELII